jgi:hypothetical protein
MTVPERRLATVKFLAVELIGALHDGLVQQRGRADVLSGYTDGRVERFPAAATKARPSPPTHVTSNADAHHE